MNSKRVKFGIFAPQVGQTWERISQLASTADTLGFDSLWLVDHMWMRGLPDLDHLEAWTTISALATVTERLRLGTLVLCNSYRNPALVAKMAASLDRISQGRLVLGLGAGWMEEEYQAYGYPFPPIRVRLEQLEEAVQVIKRLFTEQRASFLGKYYTLNDAPNQPKPVQQPHPPILIGGAGERRLLRIVAEHADIWNCPNNVAPLLPQRLATLRRHCEAVGRDPDEIEVSEQCVFVLGKDEVDLEHKTATAKALLGHTFDIDQTALRGTPQQLIEAIRARQAQGVSFFIVLFGDWNQPETLHLFAEQVMPAFR